MAGSLINPTGLTKSMFVAPDLPDKVDTTGFANTMMALQDPAGALSRKQNEQIAETTAGMTLDGLQGDILNAGFRDWDNYKTKYKDYLSSNKGFARLRLDTQQKAEMDREKQKLSANVWWGKKVQQNYIDVLKQARVDAGEGKIDPAELQAFEDKWVDLVKNNKGGLGDLPMPESLYNNMVHPKPKIETPAQQKAETDMLNEGQTGETFDEEKAKRMIASHNSKKTVQELKDAWKGGKKGLTEYQRASISLRREAFNYKKSKDAQTAAKKTAKVVVPKVDNGWEVPYDKAPLYTGEAYSTDASKKVPINKGKIWKVEKTDDGRLRTIVRVTKKQDDGSNKDFDYYIPFNKTLVQELEKKGVALQDFYTHYDTEGQPETQTSEDEVIDLDNLGE